jgi:hypothetical protein
MMVRVAELRDRLGVPAFAAAERPRTISADATTAGGPRPPARRAAIRQ